jgi:hypothetical protein
LKPDSRVWVAAVMIGSFQRSVSDNDHDVLRPQDRRRGGLTRAAAGVAVRRDCSEKGRGPTDGLFMKAPAVDYVRPRSLAEAVDLLAKRGGEARVIAGGQSLVAMMNLRVASPGLLIDISRLPELSTIRTMPMR